MKKITLLLSFVALLGFGAFAQSEFHADEVELYVTGLKDDPDMKAYVAIENKGSNTLAAKVKRTVVENTAGVKDYFCFFACFAPNTEESPIVFDMAPGDDEELQMHVTPGGTTGQVTIKYEVIDTNGHSDPLVVTTHFNISSVSIDDLDNSLPSLKLASANPANNYAGFSYNKGTAESISLVMYNMLGSKVKEVNFEKEKGHYIADTSVLESGVYFYSFVADNKVLSTKKLVVSHQ